MPSRNADTLARQFPLPGDKHLTFDEASHTYTAWKVCVPRSVTAIVGSLFERFDPAGCAGEYYERWARDSRSPYHAVIRHVRAHGGTDADAAAAICQGWERLGGEASRLGTALHLHAELNANGVPANAPAELSKEVEQFDAFMRSDFVRAPDLRPFRTELAVAWCADERAVTAGQIDALFRSRDGLVTMIDFKRVASKHSLQPWASAFRHAYGRPPVALLPDTPFWRYSLQQSLYNVMLKQVRRPSCSHRYAPNAMPVHRHAPSACAHRARVHADPRRRL